MNRHPHSHMTEDEFIGFILDELPPNRENMLDQHLVDCVTCARKLEDFYTAQEEFPEDEWARQREAFMANLQQRIFASQAPPDQPSRWVRLLSQLRDLVIVPHAGLRRAEAKSLLLTKGEHDNGTLRWRVVEDADGNLTIRFGSHVLELEGVRVLSLRVGDIQRALVLERVAPDQVGAEIIITREERAQLPAGSAEVSLFVDEKTQARDSED